MVWITSSRKPFPRICILVSLHYFPLRQTDHRDTGGLSGSGMHQPPTFACRRHTWDCLEREGGSHDLEGKLNIAFGSTEGKCNHHHHHLVSWGGGGDSRELPGIISWDTASSVTLVADDRWSQNGGGQQAQGAVFLYWSRRVEALGWQGCLWEHIKRRDVFSLSKGEFFLGGGVRRELAAELEITEKLSKGIKWWLILRKTKFTRKEIQKTTWCSCE